MDKINEKEASDIQTYLASFNKEIECDDLDDDSENENYHLSEANCVDSKVSYTSRDVPSTKKKSAEIIRLGSKKDNIINEDISVSESGEIIIPVEEELHIDDQRTLEMVAQFAEEAAHHTNAIGAYQAVTVVPSDTNPGELSYVVFVSDPSACLPQDEEEMDEELYDVNGNEAFDDSFLTKQIASDRIKMRTIRLSNRKNPLNNYRNCIQQHVCNYCSYTSTKRYLLSRHMKSHSDERPHKCGVCERGFKTLASLQNHVNTHTGTRPHPCKECDSCFTTSGELVRHVRYKHTHEKPHKCTECDYASVELSKLKRHMRCHTGERPYQCPHCTYASPDTYKLKRHLRIHTGEKPYECDICQTRFTQSNSLKAHKLIHSGNKPVFHCEYCPATCGRKTDLRIHMEKLHSSDKPQRCNRCGKVFLDRYSYKIHIKSHEGEKCFKCDLCNYASISQRHLETHMFVHTDQKPFHCDECDQSFRQKQLLKRHKNIYHDPNYVPPEPKAKEHVCMLCSKAFRHRGNLVRHFALHDPDATVTEKEAAMRLGLPKNPGEDQDGEEDDIEFPEDPDKSDQQVVVFEVIQLPSANNAHSDEQTVTMIDGTTLLLNDGDTQEYSIIEEADDNVTNFLSFNDSVSDAEDVENMSSLSSGLVSTKIAAGVQKKPNGVTKKQKNLENTDKQNQSFCIQSRRQKPRILKVIAQKEKYAKNHALPQGLDYEEESMMVKGKDLDNDKSFEVEKDFEECFRFEVKEEEETEDDLLTIADNASYQAFHSSLVQDIS